MVRYIGNPDQPVLRICPHRRRRLAEEGLGSQLMERLMSIARERGLQVMEGDVLAQNTKMLRLCAALGFHTVRNEDDPEVVIVRRQL